MRGNGAGDGGADEAADAADLTPVLAAAAQIRELASGVIAAAMWPHSNEESVAAVRELALAARQVEAAYLSAVADMDSRTGTVKGAPAGFEARIFIKNQLRRTQTQAKADVAAANALKPDADPAKGGLPRLGEAFAQGQVSREHVDTAVRMVHAIPEDLLGLPVLDEDGAPVLDDDQRPQCAGDVIDERITQHAQEYDSYALNRLATELQDVVDPDGSRNYDPESCLKRRLTLRQDFAGMWNLRADLPPAEGALLKALLDHLVKPTTGDAEDADGNRIRITDTRSTTQRYADALHTIVEQAAAATKFGSRGGEPPRITIITRAEDLAAARACAPSSDGGCLGTGEHISPGLLAQLSCDAILQRALLAPNGAVLDLGREVRTVTPAQRRALIARDRGCVIPSCTAPPHLCEGHHIRWWSADGPTDIANLALVCTRHHTEIHTGAWVLVMRDGIPWARPPDWLTSRPDLMRNRFHEHRQEIRDYGTQLRLQLDDPPNDLPGDHAGDPPGDPPDQQAA